MSQGLDQDKLVTHSDQKERGGRLSANGRTTLVKSKGFEPALRDAVNFTDTC